MSRLFPAFLSTFLVTMLVLAVLALRPGAGTAQSPVGFGADANPEGNSATALGTTQGCISVNSGDTFDMDIFVRDVESLVAWELYVAVDPAVLEFVDADMYMLLASNARSNLILESVPYSGGQHFLGAADSGRGVPESGSGVLARVTLHAKAGGLSPINVPSIDVDGDGDVDKGPRLTASGGIAVGDVTGDGVFDGPTYHAVIAVDQNCAAPPTPTLPPPSASPEPTQPSPPSDRTPPTEPKPETLERELARVFGVVPEENDSATGANAGTGSDGDPGASPGGQNSEDGSEGASSPVVLASEGSPVPADAGDDLPPASGGRSASSDGDGSRLPLWAIVLTSVVVLVSGAGASVYFAARLTERSRR